MRVRLAALILEQEINRYRDRHQGPILTRAAPLFERLTLPGFIQDVDDKGQLDLSRRVELGPSASLPDVVYLQGGIYNPEHPRFGALTEVVTLSVPK